MLPILEQWMGETVCAASTEQCVLATLIGAQRPAAPALR
jgi:hypothetical protein